jgi:hypothetical protein
MIGLLLKDLSIIKTQIRSVVLIMIIALFMMLAGNNTTFAVVYSNILFVTFGINTLSYDSHDNGNAFLFTLPIDRKLYVLEKYVFSMLSVVTGTILSLILMLGVSFVKDNYILTSSEISFVIGYAIGAFVVLAIMLPVNLKYGPEKGRVAMIILIAIAMAGVFSISKVAGTMDFTELYFEMRKIPTFFIWVIMILLTLTIISISYMISCKVMEKKEF